MQSISMNMPCYDIESDLKEYLEAGFGQTIPGQPDRIEKSFSGENLSSVATPGFLPMEVFFL
jgi:hypothetical protein